MNKILIPTALTLVIIIAGAFALMPVEKASTVHGTLATSSGQTTTQNTIASEADGQDRSISFYYNMTHTQEITGSANTTIILGNAGETYTGYATLTAIPNKTTKEPGESLGSTMNCGLATTGQNEGAAPRALGLNATGGLSNFTRFSTANGLTEGEGIMVQLVNGTGVTGVCAGMIVLTNWGS